MTDVTNAATFIVIAVLLGACSCLNRWLTHKEIMAGKRDPKDSSNAK